MRLYEVFDPRNGIPVGIKYPWRWMARVASKLMNLDYALEGDGWSWTNGRIARTSD